MPLVNTRTESIFVYMYTTRKYDDDGRSMFVTEPSIQLVQVFILAGDRFNYLLVTLASYDRKSIEPWIDTLLSS